MYCCTPVSAIPPVPAVLLRIVRVARVALAQDRLLLSYAERVEKNLDVKAVQSHGGDKDELVFDLVGVDASIANALRRILLAEVTRMIGQKRWVFPSFWGGEGRINILIMCAGRRVGNTSAEYLLRVPKMQGMMFQRWHRNPFLLCSSVAKEENGAVPCSFLISSSHNRSWS